MEGNPELIDGVIRLLPNVKKKEIAKLDKGQSYLLMESKPERCFELFQEMLLADMKGLCITRTHPEMIQQKY